MWNFKFLLWNALLILTESVNWYFNLSSWEKVVNISDEFTIWDLIYFFQAFNDYICHYIFLEAKQIKLQSSHLIDTA